MPISRKKISVIWGTKRLIDFLQIEAAFRKTNYTTFSYLLIPIYGQDMSETEFLTVCAGCSIFTDIWASENQSLRASEGIAAPQSRENLQTLVRSEAGLCPPLHHTNVCKISRVWGAYFHYVVFNKLALSNLAILLSFRWTCPYQKLKKTGEGSIVISLKTFEYKYVYQ